jgi:putative ABC transport system substrate-binding protein
MNTIFGHYTRARHETKRRFFSALLLVVSLLTTFGSIGQAWAQTDIKRVGVLTFTSSTDNPTRKYWTGVFRRALSDLGWTEGKNIAFEYRSAHSDPSRMAHAATALAALKVDVIWASSAPIVRAVHAATSTIPIVAIDFTTDPIAEGYIESYARPGGNVTGVFLDAPKFAGKWFELLSAMVPDLSRVAVLWDPGPGVIHLQAVRNVAGPLGIKLDILEVHKPDDLDNAFDALRGRVQAVVILPSPMLFDQGAQLASLTLKHKLPAISMAQLFVKESGLISYGPEAHSAYASSAVLVSKILSGGTPAELPIERPTKIHLLVNLKTAKALNLTIPQSILLRADEVIR